MRWTKGGEDYREMERKRGGGKAERVKAGEQKD